MSRAEKRERAAYHDSRRYLKRHPPRLSDPLFGIRPREEWLGAVRQAVRRYPAMVKARRENLAAGGLGGVRKGPSAEMVVMRHSGGPVDAVDAALSHLPPERRRRVRAVCFAGADREKGDRAIVDLFYRYVAVHLGFGRKRYDCRTL